MLVKNTIITLSIAGVLVSTPVLIYPKDIVKCPDTLSVWLRHTISYIGEEENVDEWKTPQETLKDKGGDCEDLSFLNQAILKDLGYDAKVLWIYGRTYDTKGEKIQDISYSHAICIFKTADGKYQHMNNLYFIPRKFDTIEQVVAYCCRRWTWFREIKLPNIKYKIHRRK